MHDELSESEKEVIAIKKEVDSIKPDVFLTVHSGTYGMYTPYAYSTEKRNNINNNIIFKATAHEK